MDSSIISAIISAVASVGVGFVGLFAGKKDAKTLSYRQIREDQLSKVWEPMDKLLSFSFDISPSKTLEAVTSIVFENYKLVPNEIIREVTLLKTKRGEQLSASDLSKLKAITSSFYNWTKRSLGYPYDKKQIEPMYTPVPYLNIFLAVLGNWFLLLTYLCSVLILMAYLDIIPIQETINIPEWMLVISAFILTFGTAWIFFYNVTESHSKQR